MLFGTSRIAQIDFSIFEALCDVLCCLRIAHIAIAVIRRTFKA